MKKTGFYFFILTLALGVSTNNGNTAENNEQESKTSRNYEIPHPTPQQINDYLKTHPDFQKELVIETVFCTIKWDVTPPCYISSDHYSKLLVNFQEGSQRLITCKEINPVTQYCYARLRPENNNNLDYPLDIIQPPNILDITVHDLYYSTGPNSNILRLRFTGTTIPSLKSLVIVFINENSDPKEKEEFGNNMGLGVLTVSKR